MNTPRHTWSIFGSHARKQASASSDLDVLLTFPDAKSLTEIIAFLDHPYFSNLLEELRPYSIYSGGRLDLHVDCPSEDRIFSAYNYSRTIGGHHDDYLYIKHQCKPVSLKVFLRCLLWWTGVTKTATAPVTSQLASAMS